MTRERALKYARESLTRLYSQYHSRGVEAVYLWGSVITEDYNPKTSDIDSIAIVKSETSIELEEELISYLQEHTLQVKDFKIRLLYLDELNQGVQKGYLTFYIPVQVLLLDFPFWEYVAGRKFLRDDFLLLDISLEQAICLRARSAARDVSLIYSVKKVARICHTIYEIKYGRRPYSHSALKGEVMPETREIVSIVLKLRQDGYTKRALDEASLKISQFLAWTGEKYCE